MGMEVLKMLQSDTFLGSRVFLIPPLSTQEANWKTIHFQVFMAPVGLDLYLLHLPLINFSPIGPMN